MTPIGVLLIIVALCEASLSFAFTIDSEALRRVCSPNEEPYGFTSPDQVKKLIQLFAGDKSQCPAEYHESFDDLGEILGDQVVADVCGPEAYRRIRAFHTKYVSYYTPEASREKLEEAKKEGAGTILRPIPESLRRFFILFVLQINAQCKRNAVLRLYQEVGDLVGKEDFDLLHRMKKEASRLMGDDYVERVKKMKDLEVLDDGESALLAPGDDEAGDAKLYIQVRFGDVIKMAKDVCENKFRPIYEEIFVPVAKLNNLGYRDNLYSEQENIELDTVKDYTRWFGVIETCELLKDIDVIEDSSSLNAVADLLKTNDLMYAGNKHDTQKTKNELNKISVLTREEASELRARIARNIENESKVQVYEARRVDFRHDVIAFTPRMWIQGDRERDLEVREFERRVRKLVHKKTSFFVLKRKAIFMELRKRFRKFKVQFRNQDETTVVGRISAFMERHKVSVRLALACFGMLIMIMVHAG